MVLVKMQPLNINVKGLSPVKQFFLSLSLSLYLSPSCGESEKLFVINRQELNITKITECREVKVLPHSDIVFHSFKISPIDSL